MANNMGSSMGAPKKKGLSDYLIYIIAAVIAIMLGIWGGYVCEMTAKKDSIQWMKALNAAGDYANPQSVINAVKAVFIGNGIALSPQRFGTRLCKMGYKAGKGYNRRQK